MIHLPKTSADLMLFYVFWFGGLWTLCYEFFFILSTYHSDWNHMVIIHLSVAGFLALSIYTNMFLLISTDVTINSVSLPDDPQPDWRYCGKCQVNAPPRSHHCKICDICILKRDHHCWFAGYCIGYHNHRYFFCLAFYMTIAGIYCNIFNWDFVTNVKGGFTWTTLPSLLAPHIGLIFGYYTLYEFFITAMTSIGTFVTIFFIWLLELQIVQLFKGQVRYERAKGINDYSLGLRNTFNEIFGSAGLLVFLCPLIPTKLPGDGVHFPTAKTKMN